MEPRNCALAPFEMLFCYFDISKLDPPRGELAVLEHHAPHIAVIYFPFFDGNRVKDISPARLGARELQYRLVPMCRGRRKIRGHMQIRNALAQQPDAASRTRTLQIKI